MKPLDLTPDEARELEHALPRVIALDMKRLRKTSGLGNGAYELAHIHGRIQLLNEVLRKVQLA